MDNELIPVVVGGAALARPSDAVLAAPVEAAATHPVGCPCCRPRSALGAALAGLFLRRARDPRGGFERVLVVGAEPEAVAAAIEADVLARARYRFVGGAADYGRSASAAAEGGLATPLPSTE